MKIIKPGDLKRLDTARRFACGRCGCEFEADSAEYRTETDFRNGHYYVTACPTCKRDVVCRPEDERREETQ